jgi:DNA repair exonuclease SbcCD ATPase subunit
MRAAVVASQEARAHAELGSKIERRRQLVTSALGDIDSIRQDAVNEMREEIAELEVTIETAIVDLEQMDLKLHDARNALNQCESEKKPPQEANESLTNDVEANTRQFEKTKV